MLEDRLAAIVGPAHIDVADTISDDVTHDEALDGDPVRVSEKPLRMPFHRPSRARRLSLTDN